MQGLFDLYTVCILLFHYAFYLMSADSSGTIISIPASSFVATIWHPRRELWDRGGERCVCEREREREREKEARGYEVWIGGG